MRNDRAEVRRGRLADQTRTFSKVLRFCLSPSPQRPGSAQSRQATAVQPLAGQVQRHRSCSAQGESEEFRVGWVQTLQSRPAAHGPRV